LGRILIAVVLVGGALAQPVQSQDFQAGQVALGLGDYATAMRELQPLAEQGHAKALFLLGHMHDYGHGTLQSYSEAAKRYRKAAELGHAEAQLNLGQLYISGRGVPQDYVKGHMWVNLSVAQSDIGSIVREGVARFMTPAQIAEAQKLARECLARSYKNCK
jgi:uncharacterized protein